ncbi:MAG: ATP-dependent Clp protease ATP-binding subunit, partial [Actinomadura rubrobrunea]|nr:ATP-dependent Clp protease ATP-binding subunit [Actinomadura rubrobrunea]
MFGRGAFGSDPFEDFFARFFGPGIARRPMHRIDIGRLMNEEAREALRDAAAKAAEWGSRDLDTDHLLWALTRQDATRRLLKRAGTEPDTIAREVESEVARGEPRDTPPVMTPAAKRALLDAHQISRALGATYISPEHMLFALPLNPESPAGRILARVRLTPETLQGAGAGGGPGAPPPTGTPTLD